MIILSWKQLNKAYEEELELALVEYTSHDNQFHYDYDYSKIIELTDKTVKFKNGWVDIIDEFPGPNEIYPYATVYVTKDEDEQVIRATLLFLNSLR